MWFRYYYYRTWEMLSVQSIVKKQVDRLVENMTTELPPPLPGDVNEVFPVGIVLLNFPPSYQLLEVFPDKYNSGVDDVLSMDGEHLLIFLEIGLQCFRWALDVMALYTYCIEKAAANPSKTSPGPYKKKPSYKEPYIITECLNTSNKGCKKQITLKYGCKTCSTLTMNSWLDKWTVMNVSPSWTSWSLIK